MIRSLLLCAAMAAMAPSAGRSLEVTAGSRDVAADNRGWAIQIEGLRMLLMNEIACARSGGVFVPGNDTPDNGACTDTPLLVCAHRGGYFAPGSSQADADGCVIPAGGGPAVALPDAPGE